MTRPEESGRPLPSGDGIPDSETLRRAIALVRVLRNPALPGVLFLLGLVLAGGITLVLALFAVAGTPYVPLQMPYLVSGAFTGVAFVTAGALLAAIQAERLDRVRARSEMQVVVDELSALVRSAARNRRGGTPSS